MKEVMQSLVALGAVLALVAPSAAQPTAGAPVETGEPVPLAPEKQKLILEHVKRSKDLPKAKLSEPARVGMVIPQGVELLKLPQDAPTATPTVTSYEYLITGDVIAIVDPESRQVIQLIKL